MFIVDGYSRHVQLLRGHETINVLYRPATSSERDIFRYMIKKLSENTATIAIYEFAMRHIQRSDIAIFPGNPFWEPMQALDEQHPVLFKQLWDAIQGIGPDARGEFWCEREMLLRWNLRHGVRLAMLNPRLANRSCQDCQRLWYSEKTGLPILVNSTGIPMLREGPTPCQVDTGCAKGTPTRQKSLWKANRLAMKHYLECRATGNFPDDAIVRETAVIIERALASKAK